MTFTNGSGSYTVDNFQSGYTYFGIFIAKTEYMACDSVIQTTTQTGTFTLYGGSGGALFTGSTWYTIVWIGVK